MVDPAKALANQLAETYASDRGHGVLQFLQAHGMLAEPHATDRADHEASLGNDSENVGIWGRDGHVWTRTPRTSAQWGLWATVHQLPSKSSKKRVVLLGESAARGFLYDPAFNPAQALNAMLQAAAGGDAIEVLDLAKTGILLPELWRLAESAFLLQPDIVILFAGNNWAPRVHIDVSDTERLARAASVRTAGLAGLRAFAEDKLSRQSASLVRHVADWTRLHRAGFIVVVPEFNLKDWEHDMSCPPWSAETGPHGWGSERARARAAEHAGRGEESLRLLETARDARLWDPTSTTPMAPRAVQDAIRHEALASGATVVDLPQLFRAHLHGAAPDRSLFLDYCHLSFDGILLAAKAMAHATCALLAIDRPGPLAIDGVRLDPGARAIAEAHAGAALHNAHWGQAEEIIGYHAAKALQANPAIATLLSHYVEITTRSAPGWTCRATEQLAGASNLSLIRFVLAMLPREPRLMDRVLIRAMAGLLGPEFQAVADRTREGEYGSQRSIDLQEPYFSLESLADREAGWNLRRNSSRPGPDYFRAYHSESKFTLVLAEPSDVQLALTFRVPASGASRAIHVSLNNHPIGTAGAQPVWQRVTLNASESLTARGTNEVVVRWPAAVGQSDEALATAADAIETGQVPEFCPIFGEVHTFHVKVVPSRPSALAGLATASHAKAPEAVRVGAEPERPLPPGRGHVR